MADDNVIRQVSARSRVAIVLAPCLSAVCLLHCVGTALLVPLAPALAVALDASVHEWLGVALSAVLVPCGVRAWAGRARWYAAGLAAGAVAVALHGLVAEDEAATQVALTLLATVQVASAVRQLLARRTCCGAGAGTSSPAEQPEQRAPNVCG